MFQNNYQEIALKYVVDDLPGSLIPGSRLRKILERLELSENCITEYSLSFFQKQGLIALSLYAQKKISYSDFFAQAQTEKSKRVHAAQLRIEKEKAEQEEKRRIIKAESDAYFQKEAARRRAYENDPRTIAKRKRRELKENYGFYFFIEQEDYTKVMNIISKLENHTRLSEKDILWLSTTEDGEYFTPELREAYHMIEAKYHENKFKKNKNPWSAINASSHFRKCDLPEKSITLLSQINLPKIRKKHIKSAICTTKGGAMRDIGKFQEAISLGNEAHAYDPKSFHPCTLLGAVNYELGNLAEGDLWFQKAQQRGASTDSVDHELKSIFRRANKAKKEKMRQHLLQIDPNRYNWLK